LGPIAQFLMSLHNDPGFNPLRGALADQVQVGQPSGPSAAAVGPPAPLPQPVRQMDGQPDDTSRPGFMKQMSPLLIAQLADLVSTEAMRMGGHSQEDDPLIRNLQVGGSNAPAMAISALLEALVLHAISKKHPGIGSALTTAETSARGTLAGQNMAQVGSRPGTDARLSVWKQ
jgi:hypothetical protein